MLVTRIGELGKVGCFGLVSSFQQQTGQVILCQAPTRTEPPLGIVLSCAGNREQNENY